MRYFLLPLLFLLLTPPLFGQNSYSDFERGLNLSDAQRAKMEDVKKKYIPEWRASGREIMKRRMELRDLYGNPSANRERIDKLQGEILDIQISRDEMYGRYRGEVSKVLNEEQREKYDSFSSSERKRSMRNMGMGLRGYGR